MKFKTRLNRLLKKCRRLCLRPGRARQKGRPSFLGLFAALLLVTLITVRYSAIPDELSSTGLSRLAGDLRPAAEELSSNGRLVVESSLKNARVLIRSEASNEVVADFTGGTQPLDLAPGTYRIEFMSPFGFRALEPVKIVTLAPMSTVAVRGEFEATCNTPLLGVYVYPNTAGYLIRDVNGKTVATGAGPDFFKLPEGLYVIEFETLDGYHPPRPNGLKLLTGKTTFVNAAYVPLK